MLKQFDIVYNNACTDTCRLDLYIPENSDTYPLFIYFHGGGLESGDKNGVHCFVDDLVKKGIAVASVNYRMYPKYNYLDALNDSASAIAFLLNGKAGNYSFSKISVGGSSAGGWIAMMLYFNPEYYRAAGVDKSAINSYVFDAGQPTSHFNVIHQEYGVDSRTVMIDKTAPLFYLNKPFTNPEKEPDIYIIYAEHDMVNRPEQLQVLRVAMLQFGFLKEKLFMHFMPGFSHCAYLDNPKFIQILLDAAGE